jgi:hypothetical protein
VGVGLMDFYLAHLKTESPTIIPRRRSARGYVGVRETIPGSTLGGAVLTSLIWHKMITPQEAEELGKRQMLISSPAFPRERSLLYPSHPFIWRCKEPGCGTYVSTLDTVFKVLEEGREIDPDVIPSTCEKGHRALEKLHPRPLPAAILRQGGESLRKELDRIESVKVVSVPVSRHRASSIVGALYSYESLPTDMEYWAIMAVKEGILAEGDYVLRIGRGVSKGFGKVGLSLKRINIERLANASSVKGQHIVLYSLSHVVFKDNNWQIDLHEYGNLTGKPSAGKVNVKAVYGSTESLGGWDTMRNMQWRVENAASPGSLVAAEVEGYGVEVVNGLAFLGLLGQKVDFDEFSLVGVNMMLPLDTVLGDVLAS